MGDIARLSLKNEDVLYKMLGVNAELLIDHAWGYEPVTIESIKAYKPVVNSISSGQVLHCPYDYKKTKLIIKEMAELLSLDLTSKGIVTNQLVLTVGYDIDNLKDSVLRKRYNGEIIIDRYGREIPKHAHGTINLEEYTSSTKIILENIMSLYERIINKDLLCRRINITANKIIEEEKAPKKNFEQIDLFTDYAKKEKDKEKELHEREIQKAMIGIKNKYGKNAIIKGMNLEEGGTTIDRNNQVGGHKA